jgi:hypothetical protein
MCEMNSRAARLPPVSEVIHKEGARVTVKAPEVRGRTRPIKQNVESARATSVLKSLGIETMDREATTENTPLRHTVKSV